MATTKTKTAGEPGGFNMAIIQTKATGIWYLGIDSVWRRLGALKDKPALFNGGIPNRHYKDFKAVHPNIEISRSWAELWPEMPNLSRRTTTVSGC